MSGPGEAVGQEVPKTPEELAAEKASTPAARIGFSADAVLVVQIDMSRMGMAQARGTLLNADDIVKQWYNERAKYENQNKKKIHLPGANAAKDAVINFFKRG
jgi:hypothetical protein